MCGIIGYLSNDNQNTINILYEGLRQLQNRGYDSAGICYIQNNDIKNIKYASNSNINALDKLKKSINFEININSGIGHTRWATHGAKTDKNAHPHICYQNKFMLVHNGIIENFKSLKDNLIEKGVTFKSETDTEVIVNMISYFNNTFSIEESIQKTLEKCEGTWAVIIITLKQNNTLYLSRHGSPLLLSYDDNKALIISENLSWDQFSKINFYLHELPGAKPVITVGRNYPYGDSYTHILGYVSQASENDLINNKVIRDRNVPGLRVGKSGLEKRFEKELIGTNSIQRYEVNAFGKRINQIDYKNKEIEYNLWKKKSYDFLINSINKLSK